MKKTWMWMVVAAAVCGGLAAGCGKGASSPVPLPPQQEAKAAVDGAIAAVQAGRLDEVFRMLPDSYQADVSRVVKAYAAKIDRSLYEQGAGVLAAAGDLIAAQAPNLVELLSDSEEFGFSIPDGVDAGKVSADQIRQAGQWLAGIAKSLSYDDIAAGNIQPLLANPLTAGLLAEGIRQLPAGALSCEVAGDEGEVKADGIETLRLTTRLSEDGGAETQDVQFVKVEGKWVPLDLTQGWRAAVDEALSAAQEFEIDDSARQMADTLAPVLKRTLESLKGAQSLQELQAQAMGAVMTIGMMLGN